MGIVEIYFYGHTGIRFCTFDRERIALKKMQIDFKIYFQILKSKNSLHAKHLTMYKK